MQKANTIFLTAMAVFLFVSGLVLMRYGMLSLVLITAGVIVACTVVVVNEIRHAAEQVIASLAAVGRD